MGNQGSDQRPRENSLVVYQKKPGLDGGAERKKSEKKIE